VIKELRPSTVIFFIGLLVVIGELTDYGELISLVLLVSFFIHLIPVKV